MNFGLAFDETIKKYGLKGRAIAEAANVSPSIVSRFRSGKAINTDSLEKLLEVLESEPLEYFAAHIVVVENLHTALKNSTMAPELIRHLNDKETAALLYALAAKIREEVP